MPQMAPMFWFILYIYFIALMLFYICNFYYLYSPSTAKLPNSVSGVGLTSLNWLW